MFARTGKFFQLLRPRSTKSGVPFTYAGHAPPLFHKIPPWWARWAVGLIACDIFLTGSAIELTWNHWSAPASNLEDPPAKGQAVSPSTTPEVYILRPTWQRLGLCVAHFGFGVGLAVALIVTQARLVRTIAILSPSASIVNTGAGGRRVFIQCAHNIKKNGTVFPLNKCSLEEGRNETEMIFRVAGERGHWHIGLDDSVINGDRASTPKARAAILANWGGKRVGHWIPTAPVDNRWKSGPVRRTL